MMGARRKITHRVHYRTQDGVDKVVDCCVIEPSKIERCSEKIKPYQDAVEKETKDKVLEILSFSKY